MLYWYCLELNLNLTSMKKETQITKEFSAAVNISKTLWPWTMKFFEFWWSTLVTLFADVSLSAVGTILKGPKTATNPEKLYEDKEL